MDTSSALNDPANLAGKIELLLLKPDMTLHELRLFCLNIKDHPLAAVCVHGAQTAHVRHSLEDSGIKVAALVGFPLGLNDSDVKRYEVETAIDNDAHEIYAVANHSWIKEGSWEPFLRELRDIVEAADERPVTIILETSLLNQDQLSQACRLILDSGAQSAQAGTGYHSPLPGKETIQCMREALGTQFGIKATGDVADSRTALDCIQAGANRVVTTARLLFADKDKPALKVL